MKYLEQPTSPTSGNWLNKVYDEMLVNLLSSHLTSYKNHQEQYAQIDTIFVILCTHS